MDGLRLGLVGLQFAASFRMAFTSSELLYFHTSLTDIPQYTYSTYIYRDLAYIQ